MRFGNESPVMQILTRSGFRRQPWKNGQGTTWEIARSPSEGDFVWRLSLAEISTSCPFSSFEAVERTILRVGGGPMTLRFDDGRTRRLEPLFAAFKFRGESHVWCELGESAAHDLNLMVRDSGARYETETLRFEESLSLVSRSGETVLAFLGSSAVVSGVSSSPICLAAWDVIRLDGEESALIQVAGPASPGVAFVARLTA
jgi:uncharacterized protein